MVVVPEIDKYDIAVFHQLSSLRRDPFLCVEVADISFAERKQILICPSLSPAVDLLEITVRDDLLQVTTDGILRNVKYSAKLVQGDRFVLII